MSPRTFMLLGASGFVGRALLREIASLPEGTVRVRALLRRPDAVPDYPFLEKVEGSLERLPAGLEPRAPYVLLHYAVKQIDHDGTGFIATNVDATGRLLRTLGPGLKGIVYSSTMSVYGQGAQDGVSEREPLRPETPLARSRQLAEELVERFARETGISAYLLRPRFVVGEGDRFVLPKLAVLARRRVRLASGSQRWSMIDVDDYARVILRLGERIAQGGSTEVRALHVGQPVSWTELAEALGAPQPRWKLPVPPRLMRVLRRVPVAEQLATRLELVGLPHWGETDALSALVGRDLAERNPLDSIRRGVVCARS